MAQWSNGNSQNPDQNTTTARKTTPSSSNNVTLDHATYFTAGQVQQLNPNTTMVMRAQNSGDMYHIRGAMILHPEYNLLIWNVNQETKKQAQQAVEVVADLSVSRKRIYYTDTDTLPDNTVLTSRFHRSETWATKDIASFFNTNPFDALANFSGRLENKTDLESKNLQDLIEQLRRSLGSLKANDSPEYATVLR